MTFKQLAVVAAIAGSALLGGCGSLKNGRAWGEDIVLFPDSNRIKRAFSRSIADPNTYAPLAGAVIFSMGSLDENTSKWASEKTPLYGSKRAASRKSNQLSKYGGAGALATALLAPSGEAYNEALLAKLKGGAVEIAAIGATLASTETIKRLSGRPRPDETDDKSFPSGHSAKAFSLSALSRRNIESISLNKPVRGALNAGFTALASATAWARVEAKAHYPSDVLAGAALANFLTLFVHDAFLGLQNPESNVFFFEPIDNGGFSLKLKIIF